MNDEGDCRTDPDTPGLLNIEYKYLKMCLNKNDKIKNSRMSVTDVFVRVI